MCSCNVRLCVGNKSSPKTKCRLKGLKCNNWITNKCTRQDIQHDIDSIKIENYIWLKLYKNKKETHINKKKRKKKTEPNKQFNKVSLKSVKVF